MLYTNDLLVMKTICHLNNLNFISADDTLFRKDVRDHVHDQSNTSPITEVNSFHEISFLTVLYLLQFDYIVDTNKQTIHEVHEGKPKLTKKRIDYLLSQLRRGTEQLLFSFLLPSTLSTTSNIVDLQKLVTTGNLFLNKFYLDNLDIKDA